MRALVQRVKMARVCVDNTCIAEIGLGFLVLLGVARRDTMDDVRWVADKVAGLRIFADEYGKMSRSLSDVAGSVLVVSQFTLYGRVERGLRPDFVEAAPGAMALPLYEAFVARLRDTGLKVVTGQFGAHMEIQLINDGPVTMMIESRER